MRSTSSIAVTPLNLGYVPGPVERFGRKLKVEYLGMASVYSIIALLYFGDLASWYETLLATLGAFFLFLGLKKKTEDHLVVSLVLFAAVSVAQAPIVVSKWVVPYLLFGLTVFVMEGYRERRPTRIYALPALFLGWSLADSTWWLGVVFSTMYLAFPRAEKPQLRRHLCYMLIAGFLVGFSSHALLDRSILSALQFHPDGHVYLERVELEMLAAIGIPTFLCLALYWRKLSAPHRWNALIFASLALWDGRFAALFAMVAAVLLCATAFRDSADSPTLRPFFKHLEWHYFWYVFAIAVLTYLSRWGIRVFSMWRCETHPGLMKESLFEFPITRLGTERFLTRLFLKISFLTFLCLFLASSSWAQQGGFSQSGNDKFLTPEQEIALEEEHSVAGEPKVAMEEEEPATCEYKIPSEKKEFLTRGQKTLLLNVGSMGGVLIYGFADWDYGESSFHFGDEGWFERDTPNGGADKFGHFWASYTLSHLYSYVYRKWGYAESEANLYGALSNLGFQTFMEVADGFSPSQGFSYEDMIMNIVGAGVAYVWGKYPSLASKIDFRMEYKPEFSSSDFGFADNYERQSFLIALKADGFDFVKNPYLRYLEFHVGYYARGYEDYEEGGTDDRRRTIYVGLGFNISKLVQKYVKTRVFDYIQIPYTSVNKTVASD